MELRLLNTEQKNKDFDYILQDPRPNTHQETMNESQEYIIFRIKP